LEAVLPIKPVISIVDDDPSVREGMMDLLASRDFVAESFVRAEDFLSSNRVESTYCLIADVQMPGMTGLELYNRLVGSGAAIPTILITAFPNEADRARALRDGVRCYLTKPVNEAELLACIRSAIKHHETDRET
jgi:FixJ family two-component response regulator